MMKRLVIVAILALSFAEAHAAIVPATSFIDTETNLIYISTGLGGPLVPATLVGSTGTVTVALAAPVPIPIIPVAVTTVTFGGDSQPVTVVNFPSVQAVSGNVSVIASTVGAVVQVGGSSVTVSNPIPVQTTGTVKVDGSAVTQPVSGTITANAGSGTFTVSGTVTANAGTNLNTSALALEAGGNLAAIKTDVDKIPAQGQALAAASMPVVFTAAQIATLTPPAAIAGFALDSTVAKDASLSTIDADLKANIVLKAGSNLIGNVGVIGSTVGAIMQVGGSSVTTVNPIPVQTTGTVTANATLSAETTKVIGTVNIAAGQTIAVTNTGTFAVQATAPTLTKGTQGANGWSTQDLKDAGRTNIIFTATFTVVSGSSVAVTQQSKAGVVTSSTSYTVTSGKTLRLQCFSAGWRATSATTGGATCRIKWATSGSPTGTSSNLDVGSLAPPPGVLVANQGYANFAHSFPDGIEVTSGQIAIEIQGTAAQGTVDVSLVGYEY